MAISKMVQIQRGALSQVLLGLQEIPTSNFQSIDASSLHAAIQILSVLQFT